ncbi:MAG: hypothetical protein AAGF79_18405 [Pseudomonadota bacterium]
MADILAGPQLRKIEIGGQDLTIFDLQTAINKARPGDVIRLTPGVYRDPVSMGRGGSNDAPITIIGPKDEDDPAVFDGDRSPEDGLYSDSWATDSHWAFVKLTGVSNVRFERIQFRNCWPAVFYLRGASEIVFSGLKGTGARHVIFARNAFFRRTRNLLLEGITWVQDPNHDMWRGRARWKEVKKRSGFADKSWFNGAMFESYDISGDVTIRDCDVSHAFNAIRMQVPGRRVSVSGGKPSVSRNRNVRIYRNRFSYIRDNAVEPEGGLHGWLVAENLFFQVHAAISCDAVAIRNGAFVANRFLNLSRAEDLSNTGGKIIKFLDPDDPKESPACFEFVTAFNSIRTRTRYVSDAKLKPWTDVNNAVERFAASGKDDTALFSRVSWSQRASTDALSTNDPEYPASYEATGANVGGWDALPKVFEMKDPEPDIGVSLGGWDGELPLSAAAAAQRTKEVDLWGPDGLRTKVAADTGSGYRSVAELGIHHWLEGFAGV